ncbi:MAG: shikimate dehydrogenase, partial [Anaerolineae bacterium]
VAVAVAAIRQAAQIMDLPIQQATIAVVGAAGAIGSLCAEMLAADAQRMLLIGRRLNKLNEVAGRVRQAGNTQVIVTSDLGQLTKAHLIITVTSAIDRIIQPEHLRETAVICDVARPRDVSRQVAAARPDVFVIEGGMVEAPGPVDFGFNFGFPPKMAYACMAETMALALEQRYESFTLGKDITLSQVLTIDKIAAEHGFKLGGFRSFERAITEAEITEIKAYRRGRKTRFSVDDALTAANVPHRPETRREKAYE